MFRVQEFRILFVRFPLSQLAVSSFEFQGVGALPAVCKGKCTGSLMIYIILIRWAL